MSLRKKWMMGLLGLGTAVTLAVSAGAVYAQTATPDEAPPLETQQFGQDVDHKALLAEALGISVEELEAAQAEVQANLLAEAVAAGEITQEEADWMQARQALREYLRERMQTAYEEAVQQAVDDGVITQEQAGEFLSQEGQEGWGLFGGQGLRGGRFGGMHGRGLRGGPGMHGGRFGGPLGGFDRWPDDMPNDAPAQPDDETQESSGNTTQPAASINL